MSVSRCAVSRCRIVPFVLVPLSACASLHTVHPALNLGRRASGALPDFASVNDESDSRPPERDVGVHAEVAVGKPRRQVVDLAPAEALRRSQRRAGDARHGLSAPAQDSAVIAIQDGIPKSPVSLPTAPPQPCPSAGRSSPAVTPPGRLKLSGRVWLVRPGVDARTTDARIGLDLGDGGGAGSREWIPPHHRHIGAGQMRAESLARPRAHRAGRRDRQSIT